MVAAGRFGPVLLLLPALAPGFGPSSSSFFMLGFGFGILVFLSILPEPRQNGRRSRSPLLGELVLDVAQRRPEEGATQEAATRGVVGQDG